jgi:hypothetical protein
MMKIEGNIKLSLLMFTLMFSSAVMAAEEVGEVGFARGVLTGQIDGEPPRILGKGLPLHNGETLNTGSSGFAVIKLEDGSRMTLRPNTTFKIENIDTRQGSENALLRLFRGGFRAITGFISKRRPDSFKVNTRVATIGIRGTEFDARLCENTECDEENKATGKTAEPESRVIGRIALLRGKASALDANTKSRALHTGSAVYEQDQLQTGIKSFAVVAFNDKSRITMSAGTAFTIEEHRYKPDVPDENNAFLRFLRGGLRFITGAIGRLNQASYRVATPTATIGIRGTGFDLVCDGECVDNAAHFNPLRDSVLSGLMDYFLKPVFALDGNGMYARVWEGTIQLQLQGSKYYLENGKTAFLKNAFAKPVVVDDIPVHLRKMGGAPRPDKIEVSDDLFGGLESGVIDPGLYVNVRDGDVEVRGADGSIALLGKGEASVTGLNGATLRLNFVPPFQKFDTIPEPNQVTPQMEKAINFFGSDGAQKKEFECRLQ